MTALGTAREQRIARGECHLVDRERILGIDSYKHHGQYAVSHAKDIILCLADGTMLRQYF
jgi:hypothetical protein